MAKSRTTPSSAPVDAVRHADTRTNIPTNELRGFVEADEAAPQTLFYPRDPSLDPQIADPWDAENAMRRMIQSRNHPDTSSQEN